MSLKMVQGSSFKLEGCDYVFRYDESRGWYDEFGNYFNKDGEPASAPEKKVDKSPNPARFKDFILFEDWTAFAIKDSNCVYYFDKEGGWYDEFDNYYDDLGEPATPPKDDEEDEDDEDEDYEFADDLLNEYDLSDEEDYDVPDKRNQAQILLESEYENIENKKRIQRYPEDELIQIDATDIGLKGKMNEFVKIVEETGADIEEFDFEYERSSRDPRIGCAEFSVRNKKSALDVISLNGKNFEGGRIVVSVREFDAADDDDDELKDEPQYAVRILFENIHSGKKMDEFRKYLENGKKIKVEDLEYKKKYYCGNVAVAAITVKSKKLVDKALKLRGTYYSGRKLDVSVLGKAILFFKYYEKSKAPEKKSETKDTLDSEQSLLKIL